MPNRERESMKNTKSVVVSSGSEKRDWIRGTSVVSCTLGETLGVLKEMLDAGVPSIAELNIQRLKRATIGRESTWVYQIDADYERREASLGTGDSE